ncbi:transposase [Rhodocaloribacter sp.]
MIESETRLRVARGIAKSETKASIKVFETLKQRGHPEAPPPVISDGWGGIDDAMIEVYGKVPPYKGRGRPPTKKRPQPGWQYLQMVKERDERGRVIGTKLRVIFGEEDEVMGKLGGSTAYIERTHLTMRHMNGRLVRKGLGFSKLVRMHEAQAVWGDAVYNLSRFVKTLRVEVAGEGSRRWQGRTPAMAAGLANHRWTIKELLTTMPLPKSNNT